MNAVEMQVLWAALEAAPEDWTLMLVLADALEEQGDVRAAGAVRWMSVNEKRPRGGSDDEGRPGVFEWWDRYVNSDSSVPEDESSDLPRELYAALPKKPMPHQILVRQYGTVRDAVSDLIAAWKEIGGVP